jgi:SAM-dependent methyltransferase
VTPLGRFRQVLADAGYDEAGLEHHIRADGRLSLSEGAAVLGLSPETGDRLPMLGRLLIGGEPVPAAAATAALAPLAPAEVPEIFAGRNGTVLPRVRIEPFEGLLVASDPTRRIGRDHVLGVGLATRLLAGLTVRRPVETALDLCTGSGAIALLLARHADVVVGTDMSRRALRLARLNAQLNAVEGIEWRQGDLFEPVADERFDLITANPPFVISPATEFTYRDAGYDDDTLTRGILAGAAERLREGGYATIVCNWISHPDELWSKRPRLWLAESGCDVLNLRLMTEQAGAYALRWNTLPGRNANRSATAARAWAEYYRERGIESLTTGVVVLRKRTGESWMHDEDLGGLPVGSASDHLERIFAGQDVLHGDGSLLDRVVTPAPGTTLVERRSPGGRLERARLSADVGLRVLGRLPAAGVAVLDGLDGTRTLGEAIDIAGAQPAECVDACRDLLGRGLLVAAS